VSTNVNARGGDHQLMLCLTRLPQSRQDPCTWRIVLKNTVDLEPPAVQAEATEKMEALVLSYQHLDSLLESAREGNTGA
jgi:hypothetical protein